ncbi:glycosyl hydrolases family 16-domain-containing protein [Polychytrium aggregatum]|uniref:glycosyl hydrolases family 16-domain-containing protein n=1 Tax=Polychytrium aggregatum TaxID=110093 RepID=UPI0022FF2959|nr:glycosyl hydrolases family 16-domain-containing protein [Polychytrium aggregatum]KAI9208893.1 glycosyl hydrolases family 16-domain-containing protein [Polychytrium aggregatum]
MLASVFSLALVAASAISSVSADPFDPSKWVLTSNSVIGQAAAAPNPPSTSGNCVVTEDFTKESSLVNFSVDYCPQNFKLTSDGAVLTMTSTCGTRISSKLAFTSGQFSAVIKSASTSSGVVTSFITRSQPENVGDEIDYEFVGISPNSVWSNVFQNADFDTRQPLEIKNSFDTSADFHKYTIDWNADRIIWLVDDQPVRTYNNPHSASLPFPVKPSYVQLGIWDGTNTGGWAGTVDFTKSFTAVFKSVTLSYPGPCQANPPPSSNTTVSGSAPVVAPSASGNIAPSASGNTAPSAPAVSGTAAPSAPVVSGTAAASAAASQSGSAPSPSASAPARAEAIAQSSGNSLHLGVSSLLGAIGAAVALMI